MVPIRDLSDKVWKGFLRALSAMYSFLFVSESDNSRQFELDGIRGWAALEVLVCHARYATHGDWDWNSVYYLMFADGTMCVNIFFILSGDALSLTTTSSKGAKGVSPGVVLKRIPRLSGTVTIAALLIWMSYLLGLHHHKLLRTVYTAPWGWGPEGIEGYSLIDYLRFSWVGIYTGTSFDINGSMHTMPTELKGSILVFAFCVALQFLKFRAVAVFIAFCYTYSYFETNIALFVYGVFLGELRALGVFDFLHKHYYTRILVGLALICVLLARLPPTREYFTWMTEFKIGYVGFDWTAYPMYLVTLYYSSKEVVGFCRNRVSRFLGDISFMLYAVHHNIIATFGCFLLFNLAPATVEGKFEVSTKIWVALAVAVVAIIVATAAHQLEKRYLYWLDRASKLLMVSPSRPPTADYQPISESKLVEVADVETGLTEGELQPPQVTISVN